MCYLVAKDVNAHGCYALKTQHGMHLVELKRFLNSIVAKHGIQLVTISRPTAYGEYAPYQFADDEEEAACAVGALAKALAEIAVYARQPQPIIERQEQEGYGSVAKDEAKAHLQIRHARRAYPSRDGDERYA